MSGGRRAEASCFTMPLEESSEGAGAAAAVCFCSTAQAEAEGRLYPHLNWSEIIMTANELVVVVVVSRGRPLLDKVIFHIFEASSFALFINVPSEKNRKTTEVSLVSSMFTAAFLSWQVVAQELVAEMF